MLKQVYCVDLDTSLLLMMLYDAGVVEQFQQSLMRFSESITIDVFRESPIIRNATFLPKTLV